MRCFKNKKKKKTHIHTDNTYHSDVVGCFFILIYILKELNAMNEYIYDVSLKVMQFKANIDK